MEQKRRKTWAKPWGYREAIIIQAGLLASGFMIEFASGGAGVHLPAFPVNAFITGGFALILILYAVFFRKNEFLRWLSGVPVALTSMISLTLLVLLMGVTRQADSAGSILSQLGLTHIFRSWPYMLEAIFLLLCLGLTATRRAFPFTLRNIAFLLNHAGLWITIAAASAGSSDLQRLTMTCKTGETVWYGSDEKGRQQELPFAIELKEFRMETYHPRLVLMEAGKTTPFSYPGDFEKGLITTTGGLSVEVKEYYHEAIGIEDRFVFASQPGACPAAFVTISGTTGKQWTGWIATGSIMQNGLVIAVENGYSVGLTLPPAKSYESKIKIYTPDQKITEADLWVNRPIKIGDWEIYQTGYDEKMGKWSQVSIIEAVRDPWLPLVYAGIFMLLAGASLLFWTGKKHPKQYV